MHLSRLLGLLCLLIVPLSTVLLSNSGGPPASAPEALGNKPVILLAATAVFLSTQGEASEETF